MSDGTRVGEDAARDRRARRLARITEGGLVDAVSRAGGQLLGFSAKYSNGEVLVTLRAVLPAGRMISFVGSETLGGCLLKAYRDANNDKLAWREDRYARG